MYCVQMQRIDTQVTVIISIAGPEMLSPKHAQRLKCITQASSANGGWFSALTSVKWMTC